jgi:hypothetical protein
LVIIDLEDPWLIPRIVPHMSKWEVADVQWSPHVARESWVASTVSDRVRDKHRMLTWIVKSKIIGLELELFWIKSD